MEDLSKSQAQDSQVKSSGHAHKATKSWTVLLIGDLGKMVSFRLTKSTLFALLVLFAAIVGVLTYTMVSYNPIRSENKHLRRDLRK